MRKTDKNNLVGYHGWIAQFVLPQVDRYLFDVEFNQGIREFGGIHYRKDKMQGVESVLVTFHALDHLNKHTSCRIQTAGCERIHLIE